MSSVSKRLPETVTAWREFAIEWNATGGLDELGSPVKVASASKFDFENFLGLQVLYDFPKEQSRLPNAITTQFPPIPGNLLESLSGYNAYLNEVEKAGKLGFSRDIIAKTRVPRTLGAFVNVWQFQRHVLVGDEDAADISKISKITPVSPVAKRTRAMTRERQREQAATPTPAPKFKRIPLVSQTANLTLGGSDLGSSSSDDEDEDEDEDDDDDDDDDNDEKNPGMHFSSLS